MEVSETEHLTHGKSEIIASNVDIKTYGNKVFFQKTPAPSIFYINPTLMETLAKALGELIQTIITNLQKIIPIGLVILSIGLVILLIKSVISQAT